MALLNLRRRRWVQFSLPVLVCVDVDAAGDQWVTHVVPVKNDIGLYLDHAREPVVYAPDFDEPIENGYRTDDVARAAINHAARTQDDWTGRSPDRDWDWYEHPDDLTVMDRYTQEEAAAQTSDEDDELERRPSL